MDTGFLNLLMDVVGPLILGLVIAYALFWTWRRRNDPVAQARTDQATHRAYEAAEREREMREGP
jgi:hypothetical protein